MVKYYTFRPVVAGFVPNKVPLKDAIDMARGAIKHLGIFFKKLLFSILAISCGLCVYQLGQRYGRSFNIQKSPETTITPTSQAVLELLEEPLEIYVFYEDISPFVANLRHLLKTYQCAAPEKIRLTFVDTIKQPRMTQDMASRFGSITRNQVVLAYKDDKRVLPSETFFDAHGQFCGESVILSSIMDWGHRGSKKILFVSGHGELDPESVHPYFGGSEWKISLQQKGYQIKKTELLDALSADDTLLIIAGPQVNISVPELAALQKFLHDGGRVLLLLSPPYTGNLEEFLDGYGLRIEGTIETQAPNDFLNLNGEFLIKNFGDHPRLQQLQGLSVLLAQSYRFLIDHSEKSIGHQLTPLLLLNAETEKSKNQDLASENEDTKAFAVLFSPVGVHSSKGKLLVLGSSNFVENRYFNDLGNRAFMSALADIMLGKSEKLGPEAIHQDCKFSLQDSDWKRIIVGLLLILCLLGGLFVVNSSQQKRK